MIIRDRFWWALFAIGVLTVVNGLAQLLAPGFVLSLVATEASSLSKHLIASLGMVVALFGGMFLYAILDDQPQPIPVLWTGLQKLATAIAVGLGVQHTTYVAPVVAFALFDLFAGAMIIGYWYWLKQKQQEAL
jgi:uncharacterized protein YjeT (DUF2065 family)